MTPTKDELLKMAQAAGLEEEFLVDPLSEQRFRVFSQIAAQARSAPTVQEPGRNHYEDGDVFERIAAVKKPPAAQPAPVPNREQIYKDAFDEGVHEGNFMAMHECRLEYFKLQDVFTPPTAPVQPVAHCEQGPNFCKQCANQQAEDCAAILYRDHNEKPWVHVIQKDLPSGTKLIAVTKGQP
jgi:hypothetical protein